MPRSRSPYNFLVSKKANVAEILQRAWRRKKSHQPNYSLRALARDLGVSAPFVSAVMKGKRPPPKDRLEKLFVFLELDVHERRQLLESLVFAGAPSQALPTPPPKKGLRARKEIGAEMGLLQSWKNLAVLEGLTLDPPWNEVPSLRARLRLTEQEMRAILKTLHSLGLAEEEQGQWRKKDELLYFSGGRSRQEVREFHDSLIQKAREELKKADQKDYNRRLISGVTLTLNPRQLEALKARLLAFLDELSQEAGSGPCSEVYQCNVQLFPLTGNSE